MSAIFVKDRQAVIIGMKDTHCLRIHKVSTDINTKNLPAQICGIDMVKHTIALSIHQGQLTAEAVAHVLKIQAVILPFGYFLTSYCIDNINDGTIRGRLLATRYIVLIAAIHAATKDKYRTALIRLFNISQRNGRMNIA